MTELLGKLTCFIKGKHIFKFSSGIADLHGQSVTDEYECERCGKRKVIENDNFKICECEECIDV